MRWGPSSQIGKPWIYLPRHQEAWPAICHGHGTAIRSWFSCWIHVFWGFHVARILDITWCRSRRVENMVPLSRSEKDEFLLLETSSDWFGTNEATLPHILRARQGYLYESAHPGPLIVIIRIYQNRHPGFHPGIDPSSSHSRALIPPVCLRWKTKLFGDLMHISGGSTAMPHFLLFHVFIAVSLSSAAALYLIQQSGVPQSVLVSSKQIPRCENIVLRDWSIGIIDNYIINN